MKNKKGFTLIELLAIIIVMALIMLVTVPIIISIVNNSRKHYAEDSAAGIYKAAKNFYIKSLVTDTGNFEEITMICDGTACGTRQTENPNKVETPLLEFTGTIPSDGSITIFKDGQIKFNDNGIDLLINGYECEHNKAGSENGKWTCN